jgi:hypothetical protein
MEKSLEGNMEIEVELQMSEEEYVFTKLEKSPLQVFLEKDEEDPFNVPFLKLIKNNALKP